MNGSQFLSLQIIDHWLMHNFVELLQAEIASAHQLTPLVFQSSGEAA
jgi:hypothetical protein